LVFLRREAWPWQNNIDGIDSRHFDRAVTVDRVGNLVAAGVTQNTGTATDFTVIKFDGVSGAELWRQVINGTANGTDRANAVTVDGVGNVVAAGATVNTGTSADFTVVKLRGTDGGDF